MLRTPTKATGGITEEEREKMAEISKKWIANAFKTGETDKVKLTKAIEDLYKVSGLKKPIVVIVPSPYTMVCAYGIASAWWESKQDSRTADRSIRRHTDQVTHDSISKAVDSAVCQAIWQAANSIPANTNISVLDAASKAIKNKDSLKQIAKHFLGDRYELAFDHMKRWNSVLQGGNMWSGWQAYADAMENVIGLTGLDCWEKHRPYRDASIYGGYRLMHEKFCMVSEFPEVLKMDDRNRPHCSDGATHRWKDGFEIYHINGIQVDKRIVMNPETITIKEIQSESNQELRRVLVEQFGVDKYLVKTGAKVIDMDHRGIEGSAPRCLLEDDTKQRWLIGTDGSTDRVYHMLVPNNAKTCREAHEALCGFDETRIKMEG